MSEFDNIRPYYDDEVTGVLERLKRDGEFIDVIARLTLPKFVQPLASLLRPLVKMRVFRELGDVDSLEKFKDCVVPHLRRQIENTIDGFSVSGLEKLDPNRAYLFISNHRDIAMDPAVVNWQLNAYGLATVRAAIGDNLVSKPYVSDLMRLNKSFIVNRSATAPREKFKAAKQLSKYIHQSVVVDKANVWIAQREGRAKDGIDDTNPAIVSMLALNKPKTQSLTEYIHEAAIVPVSISYEYDPCDVAKATELYVKETHGDYEKEEGEDVSSIALGISGYKGNTHVAFGSPLMQEYEAVEDVVKELDLQIKQQYVLHFSNIIAYELLENHIPDVMLDFPAISTLSAEFKQGYASKKNEFQSRLALVPENFRSHVLNAYANPVRAK